MSEEVVKNTKFSKLDMKLNDLENKISYASTLTHISQ